MSGKHESEVYYVMHTVKPQFRSYLLHPFNPSSFSCQWSRPRSIFLTAPKIGKCAAQRSGSTGLLNARGHRIIDAATGLAANPRHNLAPLKE